MSLTSFAIVSSRPAIAMAVLVSLVLSHRSGFAQTEENAESSIEVFSGPQIGEPLPPFEARRVFGGGPAGEMVKVAQENEADATLILFVPELTRPVIGLTRGVCQYAQRQKEPGIRTTIVFLSQDITLLEQQLKRAQHAMPKDIEVAVSLDGPEGPGSYGLNRNVALTALVGKSGKVTANFALVQPSLQVDALKIATAIAEAVGNGDPPKLEDVVPAQMAMAGGVDDDTFRAKLAPVIRRTATEEQVDDAAKAVEEFAKENPAFAERVGTVARRIIDAGRLENYGTPHAQEYLKTWAESYAPADKEK
ncbi:MAG: hypothetical protein R3E01_14350 [Pirellulaceae bacterium]|nr:hypothetical protein [Planctomycetales bacterium]